MKETSKKSIVIFTTSIVIIVLAIIIVLNMNGYFAGKNNEIKETVTIQSKKISLDIEKIEAIWNDSKLEGNKKEIAYYRFEFPMYRGESEKEAFSLYFRFYVVCEEGENYLDQRIIFGGYYNIADLAEDNKINKKFSISSGKNEMSFDIFKDEKKKFEDGNSYNMMAFSTVDVEKLQEIAGNKNVKIKITLGDKEYEYKLKKEERNKLKALVVKYLNLLKETNE